MPRPRDDLSKGQESKKSQSKNLVCLSSPSVWPLFWGAVCCWHFFFFFGDGLIVQPRPATNAGFSYVLGTLVKFNF